MNNGSEAESGRTLKSQSSLLIISTLASSLALILSFMITYSMTVILLSLCAATGIVIYRRKGSSGQAEMAVALLILILAAGSAVAHSAYNSTVNSSFTGYFSYEPNATAINGTAIVARTAEASGTVEVWADTMLDAFYENGVAAAKLELDDGTPAASQEIEFIVNGNSTLSVTDGFGLASIELNISENSTIRATYSGNGSAFLNPSESEEISLPATMRNVTVMEINTTQGCAEVGRPVTWLKTVKVENPGT